MPIKTKPLYDCCSCDAYEPNSGRPDTGYCRRNPPAGQITGLDKFNRPQVAAVFPPVGKGCWCLQHPMAKAFPVKGFALSNDPGIDTGINPLPPMETELLPIETISDNDDPLPGEERPEAEH